jgi:hypothetical protein
MMKIPKNTYIILKTAWRFESGSRLLMKSSPTHTNPTNEPTQPTNQPNPTHTNPTPTMKIINTLLLCLAATLATSQAQVIYDFSGPAGPLATSPEATLWDTLAGDTAALDGNGNLVQTGAGATSQITSKAEFNITSDTYFQFQFADYGSFYGGVAMIFNGAQGLYIRNDLGAGVQLWTYSGAPAGAAAAAAFTPVNGSLWELNYNPTTQTASAFQNGRLVGSLTGVNFGGDTTAQLRSFQYGGAGVQTTFDAMAVATVPEPSTVCLMALAVGILIVAGIRKKGRA